MTTFIGIDLGNSFLKGGVLDLDGLDISGVRRVGMPEAAPAGIPECRELDPDQVVRAVSGLIDALLRDAPDAAGLVICSQMHSFVLVDDAGEAVTNVITWQDRRASLPHPGGAENYLDWLRSRLGEEALQSLGNEVRCGAPISTLPYLLDQPGAQRLEGALVASLPDYVLSQMSGTPPTVEASMAAAYGLLDLRTQRWSEPTIGELGLSGLRFPQLVSHRETPYIIARGGRKILPCHAPVGDHQAAILGSILAPGELSINISTGSQVSALSTGFQPGPYQSRPFFGGAFLNTFTEAPAGRSLDVLLAFATEMRRLEGNDIEEPWRLVAQAVDAVPHTGLAVDLSFFSPHDADSGSLRNLRASNFSVGHVFRAAFEAMADEYARCSGQLPCAPVGGWRRIVFSGGVAQKLPILREIIERRLGIEARVCQSPEDTLLGLLAIALVVSGRARSVAESMAILQ